MTTTEIPELEATARPADFGPLEWKAMPSGETSSPLTGVIGHDDANGTVTAIIAVTGVPDKVGDVIVPGSAAQAVARLKPKGVLDHNWAQTVSKLVYADELMPGDPRLPKTTPNGDPWPVNAGGLLIKAQYNLDKQLGRDAYADAKFYGPDLCFSIGYKVRPGGARMRGGKRHLHNYDIYEWSHVLHGAHELATLTGVKSLAGSVGDDWYAEDCSGSAPVEGTIEVKAIGGRRVVRNAQFWGLPVGTPLRAGMRPRGRSHEATPQEIAATTTPETNAGTADHSTPATPGAPSPDGGVAAPGNPSVPGAATQTSPGVVKALAALHERYQQYAALQNDPARGQRAQAVMGLLGEFAAPGADVHASTDGALAALHTPTGWQLVDTTNGGRLPAPTGDVAPAQMDEALEGMSHLDIPWTDLAARRKRWADKSKQAADAAAVQGIVDKLTPFDTHTGDATQARYDAEGAIAEGNRDDLADALTRMGLPPDQDPHDVAATLLVLPSDVVDQRLDAIAAASPDGQVPVPAPAMADAAGVPPAPADVEARYAAQRAAAGVPADHSDIAPIPGTAIGRPAPDAAAPAPPAPPADAPKPYQPTGNMNAPHKLTDEQLAAEHDHAIAQHMRARRAGVPRNAAVYHDSKMAMTVFGDEKRKRAEKAAVTPQTPEAPPEDTYDEHGVAEGPDGELTLTEDAAKRQDRVEALLEAGVTALKIRSAMALGENRQDLVGELGLQTELDRRDTERRKELAVLREARSASDVTTTPDAPTQGGETPTAEPETPKLRPGIAGAAEDLGDALNATPRDEEAVTAAAERFAKLLRRRSADSKAFITVQTAIGDNIHVAIANGDLKAGMLFTAAAALREERRTARNATARDRRKARRIDRDRIRSLLGAVDTELRSRGVNPHDYGGAVDDIPDGPGPSSGPPGSRASTTAPPTAQPVAELNPEVVARIRDRETRRGRRGAVTPIDDSPYLIGAVGSDNSAIAYVPGETNRDILRSIYKEVDERGLSRPIHVYGDTSRVGETSTFKFTQLAELGGAVDAGAQSAPTEGGADDHSERRDATADRASGRPAGRPGQTRGNVPGESGPADRGATQRGGTGDVADAGATSTEPTGDGLPADRAGEPGGSGDRPGDAGLQRRTSGTEPTEQSDQPAADAGAAPETGTSEPNVEPVGTDQRDDATGADDVPEGTPELPAEQPTADRSQVDAIPDTGESFRPTGVEDLAPAGKKSKLEANLAALRVLRTLQTEHRPATEDEQRTLARWSGWGGLPDVFDDHKPEYDAQREELRGLLNDKEWAEARRNTLNAHYTSATAVQAIWSAVAELGFDGGRVLEPGSGSGTFIGFAPEHADMIGVELDSTTAAISRALYPHATIRNESFADTRAPAGSFDLTIGNVPFGDFALNDRVYNPKRKESIHNHFIIKSLGLTKPGGICAVLTSRYTLDSQGESGRRRMAEMGDLLGAVRLPTGSHSKVSGTDVIEDILIFRRREPGAEPLTDQDWIHAPKRDINGQHINYSSYFTDHPEQVLGEITAEPGQYGSGSLIVKGDKDLNDLPSALGRITETAHAQGITASPRLDDQAPLANPADDRHEGHIGVEADGTFTQAVNGVAVPFAVPTAQAEELRGLIGMRDTLSELLAAEAASLTDTKQIRDLRRALNDQYDAYAKRYGAINRYKLTANGARNTPAQGGFRRDPMSAIVRALGAYDPESGIETKTDIFRKRAVSPREIPTTADNPEDALALSMDTYGEVSLPAIAKMLDCDEPEARARLGELVFEQPPLSTAEQDAAWLAHIEASAAPGLGISTRFGGDGAGSEAGPDTSRLDTVGESVRQAGKLEPAAAYLSGNVRRKLVAAHAAAQHDERFKANVEALKAALPPDLGVDEVDGRLGSAWIGPDDIKAFLVDLLYDGDDKYGEIGVGSSGGGIWTVNGGDYGKRATEQWGTSRMSAGQLVQCLLEQRPIRVSDTIDKKSYPNLEETTAAQAKAEELSERFSEWLWEDTARQQRLLAVYNNQFNAIKLRSYDNIERTFPGMSDTFDPFDHQVAAVNRMVAEPCALLAHVVGAGKTAEMAMGTAELKRLGLAKKPAIVVPNHMLEQFSREYLEIYPNAKILAAGTDDLKADRRREFVARAATGDWDCVILTQDAMALIPMGRDQMNAYITREMAIMRDQLNKARAEANGDSAKEATMKRMEKSVIKAEEALKAKLDKVKDAGVSFEQTGIDYVCVDEAHMYSNLRTISNIQGAGATGSDKASDLHMKLEYLRANNPSGRVATFASGTPIRNTVTQAYIMQRYLDPQTLRDAGIYSFDQWAATFGQTVDEMELKPEGTGFRQTTRFAKFRNVPELLRLFHLFSDVKMADDLNLKTPDLATGAVQNVVVPASDELRAYIKELGKRADDVRAGNVEPEDDNMLKVSGDGRKAALSMRLVGEDHQPGKIEAAADNIVKIWRDTKDRPVPKDINDPAGGDDPPPGGMQIVFCDMGTPGNKKDWNAYDELRDQLVARGMERSSIRFMHEAKNDREKAELFAAARNGQVSVLVGSTERMGVGTNVQRRAVALHHLDAPWRPSDVEQRDGRIMRQGNTNKEVAIYRYVTEGSFDAYMWQTLERKKKFIDQIMRGKLGDIREIEDVGDTALSYAEVKALATGNPLLMDKAKVDVTVGKLSRLERQHARTQTNLRRDIDTYGQLAGQADRDADTYNAAAAKRTDTTHGEAFAAIVHGLKYDNRSDAADALKGAIKDRLSAARYSHDRNPAPQYLATFGGHDLMGTPDKYIDARGTSFGMSLSWDGVPGKIASLSPDNVRDLSPGVLTTLHNNLAEFESRAGIQRDRAQHYRDEIEQMKGRIGLPFTKTAELKAARDESARLQTAMETAGVGADTGPAEATVDAGLTAARNAAQRKVANMGRSSVGPEKELLKKFANPAAAGKSYASPDGALAAMGSGKSLQVFMTADGHKLYPTDEHGSEIPVKDAGVVDDPQGLLNDLAALDLPWDEGQWRFNQRYWGNDYAPADYSKSHEEREKIRKAAVAEKEQRQQKDRDAINAVWAKHLRAPDPMPESTATGMDKAKEQAAAVAENMTGDGAKMMRRFVKGGRVATYASDDGEIGAVTDTTGDVAYFATGNGMLINPTSSFAKMDDYTAVANDLAALGIPLGNATARKARWAADPGARAADLAAITDVFERHQATEGKTLAMADAVISAFDLQRARRVGVELKAAAAADPELPDEESYEDTVDQDARYVLDAGGILHKVWPCATCGNQTQYPVSGGLDSATCTSCGSKLQMQPTPATVG